MKIEADIHPTLAVGVTTWAARHGLSVSAVVRQAITEYMLDVDAGLCGLPRPEPKYMSRPVHKYIRGAG